jgi:hypothetical protein
MKIRDIIFWILVLISLGVAGWYLFGNSPTFEQTILVLMITVVFGIAMKVSIIGEKMNSMEKGFRMLAKDFKEYTRK